MSSFLATAVWHEAVNKLEALSTVAKAMDARITDLGTQTPRIVLSKSAWIQIEIPKFGEPPPVAIDVWSSRSRTEALDWAQQVIARLGQVAETAPILDEDAR